MDLHDETGTEGRFRAYAADPLLVAGFRLCRSGKNVNDQLRTLDHRVDVMSV
jgi:hypothetical protein